MKSIEERARTLTINGFYQTSSRLQKSIIEELEETEKNIRAVYQDVLNSYQDLLYQIQNSRKGNAPESVYCDNLFRVSRIDAQLIALRKLKEELNK
jgi:hypothetical protein